MKKITILLIICAIVSLLPSHLVYAKDSTSADIEGLGVNCSISDTYIDASAFKTSEPYVSVKIHEARFRFVGSNGKTRLARPVSGNVYIRYYIKNAAKDATRWVSARATAEIPGKGKVTTRVVYN